MTTPITIHHPIHFEADGAASYPPINRAEPSDVAHFVATYNQALRHAAGEAAETVQINIGLRTEPKYSGAGVMYDEGGWLEHLIMVTYKSGSRLVIGAIQRKPGQDSEFHS